MNDTQKAVDAYLEAEKINYSVRYVGETARDNDWQCDAWRVSFAAGKSRFETDYFTGLGHRKVPGNRPLKKNWEIGYVAPKPVSPCAADVLNSLILDSSAADMSFNDWCDDYGFDNDSISAFNTYQLCCKAAHDLRQVFSRAQIETLRTLLEDY